jgi:DNA-binding transcriptional regulator YiaG
MLHDQSARKRLLLARSGRIALTQIDLRRPTSAWRKLNRLSQRKAVAVLAQYYFHATFPSLRSWEEGRRSPNSHTAAILEKFLLDHPTVESPKKLKQPR